MKGKNMQEKERKMIRKMISDIGIGSYVKMHGFKAAGRKGRNFYFDIYEDQANEFDQLCLDYSNSPMHDFDACLMSLKKLPEYLPPEK